MEAIETMMISADEQIISDKTTKSYAWSGSPCASKVKSSCQYLHLILLREGSA